MMILVTHMFEKYSLLDVESVNGRSYDFDFLQDHAGTLAVGLLDEEQRHGQYFLNIICATGRWTKGMPLQGLNMMSETVESGKCLHEVDDSCFLAWFIAQGHGKEKRKARYFCIMTINDIVDVISTDDPCFF